LTSLGAEAHLGRSLDQLRELLRASRAVIAGRLHAAIIPLAERVPVIGYSATPKIGNFFRSVGLDDCYFGPGDATDSVVSGLLRVMQNGQTVPAPAGAAMQRTRETACKFLDTLTLAIRYGEVAGL
jgi:polysaccharide pyruvyl transferase WcaK-like protein